LPGGWERRRGNEAYLERAAGTVSTTKYGKRKGGLASLEVSSKQDLRRGLGTPFLKRQKVGVQTFKPEKEGELLAVSAIRQ